MSQTNDHAASYRTPRWVKVFGIIAVILILLVGFILATGLGGPHGPARHSFPGASSSTTPIEQGTQQPGP